MSGFLSVASASDLVRIIAVILFSIVLALVRVCIKKNKKLLNILSLLMVVCLLLFGIVLLNVPFENLVITHFSAQSALNYTRDGEIKGYVDGNNSTLVLHSRYDIFKKNLGVIYYDYNILPRTAKGWKIAMPKNPPSSIEKKHGEYKITIAKREKIEDVYIMIFHYLAVESEIAISDNMGSLFNVFIEPNGFTKGSVWLYAYIESIDENYEVIIDGETIKFDGLSEWLASH